MNHRFNLACFSIGAVGGVIANMLGGWDDALYTLLVFMIIDFVLGLACAAFWNKSPKSESGALSSKACGQGIMKKVGTLMIIVCAHLADILLDIDYARNAVIIAFCVAEFISIMETAGLMGILPPAVKAILDKLLDLMKNESDKK